KHGYKIYVINLADPQYSDGYNPLAHIRNTMDVDIITKIISQKDNKGNSKSSDPFWDQTSEALLKAMIKKI
ncbi:MAG: type IV secretory system conjugative DNA transfer family protein, partial [Methanobrevibacter sp.]|nr:type IV secretory system conjugative DNA transfer family protein [Methanobrevibacter sp.]